MRIPLSWLEDYVKIDLPLEELCERLTLGGLEVASVDRIGEEWDPDKIVVGQVVSVRQHPNADRLVLVTVDYGLGEPMEVVTGAPNLKVADSGQKVVFALEGARLVDPYADTLRYQTLKRSKIRGVESAGMALSEKELGISDDHTGIVILPGDAPVGVPLAEYWGDVVLDLDLTPNLARCFCVTGVAREVAALTGANLDMPSPTVKAEGESIGGRVEIEIEDPDLCPRYSAALIKGVQIAPSPQWMQRRLVLAGMRPINNIVDITNYVMLDWGQPLHAFDVRQLRPRTPGGPPTIIVRRAAEGETMSTLDGVERVLDHEMLLITDGRGPVAVAGVMGGLESEVSEDTVDILLEAANFHNVSVRRTSAALKIPSEAAQRFGRGVDPELTLIALRRAAELMRELAGGTVAAGFADVYPGAGEEQVIVFKVSEMKRLLGIELTPGEVASMLESLGFGCEAVAGQPAVLRVSVPSYRLDVGIPADLVEEMARLYGYDRLPSTLMPDELPAQHRDMSLELEERVRDVLVGCGLTETISYSLTNLESVAKLTLSQEMPKPELYIKLENPLTREREYMRRTLMNSVLETVANNLRFADRVAIFEIGSIYLPREGEDLPEEPRRLAVALTGPREVRSWLTAQDSQMDFYDLKGVVETLCIHLGVEEVSFTATKYPTYQPGRVAQLNVGGVALGVLGEVHPVVRRNYDLGDAPVCLLELDLEAFLDAATPARRFSPISRMPALKEDLAIVVDESVAADIVEATIRRVGGNLLTDVVLFDVYRGEQVGAGKISLAYSLTFQSMDKTLTTEEVAKLRGRIMQNLAREYNAEIRG
ncbi:MAG: phenylalanine--tRNA ligase subunit beta [Chloroflexi bacterium RBG_13_56_8]|nr:MAG: phenylalanine--tRNA ligase subunit beta [Chloroflexi bacterium RBG_13_56_8]